jgi:cell wall assembly regulator SMI1
MAAATVKSSYAQIIKSLESNPAAKGIVKSLHKPVDPAELDALEAQTFRKIPPQVRALYLLMAGQKNQSSEASMTTGLFPSAQTDGLAYAMISFKELSKRFKAFMKQVAKNHPGEKIQYPDYDWWPLAENMAGNSLVIRMERKNKKCHGQVLEFNHEYGGALIVADSLADFLQELATGLQRGTIFFSDDQGLSRKKGKDFEAAAQKGKLLTPPGASDETNETDTAEE